MRELKMLINILEYLTETNTNESSDVLVTNSPYIPNMTLGDVKDVLEELKSIVD